MKLKKSKLIVSVINKSTLRLQNKKIASMTEVIWLNIFNKIHKNKQNYSKKIGRKHYRHILTILAQPKLELNLIFLNQSEAKKLNFKQRRKNYATDVLSFSSEGAFQFPQIRNSIYQIVNAGHILTLGELVMCPQVLKKQAKDHGLNFYEEIYYMITHGLLHLLSLDHERSAKEERLMFLIQDELFTYIA